MRAGLEQQHVPAALGELARDHPAAGARAHDHDVESLFTRPQPRPVLVQPPRGRRVEADLGPGALGVAARRDEVGVVRLDRERADERELRRELFSSSVSCAGGESASIDVERVVPHGRRHAASSASM